MLGLVFSDYWVVEIDIVKRVDKFKWSNIEWLKPINKNSNNYKKVSILKIVVKMVRKNTDQQYVLCLFTSINTLKDLFYI